MFTKKPKKPLKSLGVTLIKPLKGIETSMEENLRCCFNQKHELFEIIFCVADKDDEAIPIVQKLMAQYPHVDARLFSGNYTVIK